MTPEIREERIPGSRDAAALAYLMLAFVTCGLIVLYVPMAKQAAILAAYSIPLVLVTGLVLSLRIVSAGTEPLPYGMLFAGISFVIGGAAFDIFATVIHSPNLDQETNPVARLLFDTGHSIGFVYVFGGFCQFADASLICLLWAGLLRHRKSIVTSVRGSTTVMQLLKALTGGAKLTWRQWLYPLKMSEFPDFSYYVWIFTAMWVAGAAYRWYLGLEWFGFSPVNNVFVAVGSMILGVSVYLTWAWRAVQRAKCDSTTIEAALTDDDGPAPPESNTEKVAGGDSA